MFHNTVGTLESVPLALRQYYTEDVRQELTGNQIPETCTYQDEEGVDQEGTRMVDEYQDVTYVVLTPFGEIQDNVAELMKRNKPQALVEKFLGFVNNGIEKQFHDDYLAWIQSEPNKDDERFFEAEVEESTDEVFSQELFNSAYQQWESAEPVKPQHKALTDYLGYRKWKQLQGVEFEGVMCSATKSDYWGLGVAFEAIKAGLSTKWNFENGNTLVLTPDNIEAFKAVWLPFRTSFFDVNFE